MPFTELRHDLLEDLPILVWTMTPQSYAARSSAAFIQVQSYGPKVTALGKDVPTSRITDMGAVASDFVDSMALNRFLETMELRDHAGQLSDSRKA